MTYLFLFSEKHAFLEVLKDFTDSAVEKNTPFSTSKLIELLLTSSVRANLSLTKFFS